MGGIGLGAEPSNPRQEYACTDRAMVHAIDWPGSFPSWVDITASAEHGPHPFLHENETVPVSACARTRPAESRRSTLVETHLQIWGGESTPLAQRRGRPADTESTSMIFEFLLPKSVPQLAYLSLATGGIESVYCGSRDPVEIPRQHRQNRRRLHARGVRDRTERWKSRHSRG